MKLNNYIDNITKLDDSNSGKFILYTYILK